MITDEMIAKLPKRPYVIDFGTEKFFETTLADAMIVAEQETFRTIVPRYPNDITIYDEDGTMVARLPWVGPSFDNYSDWLDYVKKTKGYGHCYGEWILLYPVY